MVRPGTEPQIQCGRARSEIHSNIVYSAPALAGGSKVELKMDIQVPETDGPKPLVVYVPGGGFAQAVKEGGLNSRTFVAEAGYVVASIQYRTTADRAVYTDALADVRSAISFLQANATQYGIDPARVGLWGESAGGYLVAMTGLDPSVDVQAVVEKFGLSDLTEVFADFDPATQQSYAALDAAMGRFVLGPDSSAPLTRQAAAPANPATFAKAGGPPFLHLHGTADTLISPSQTLILHNALRAARADSTRYLIDGAGHGDFTFTGDAATGLPWTTQQVMGLMTDFFAEHLG
ncbi:MAG: alpha/beta hydrolase [Kibdelosporangium sp.]